MKLILLLLLLLSVIVSYAKIPPRIRHRSVVKNVSPPPKKRDMMSCIQGCLSNPVVIVPDCDCQMVKMWYEGVKQKINV